MKSCLSMGCGCTPILVGIIFIAGGIFCFFFIGGIFTLSCTRTTGDQGNCKYIKSSYFSKEETNIKLAELKRVYLKEADGTMDDEGKKSKIYNVRIKTTKTDFSFTPYASSEKEPKQKIVDQMEKFLKDKSLKEVTVRQDDKNTGIFLGAFFGVTGLILVIGSLVIMFVLKMIGVR